eukprot:SAG22_NODE_2268_length_2769_cov_1.823970_3_plen_61_part_00
MLAVVLDAFELVQVEDVRVVDMGASVGMAPLYFARKSASRRIPFALPAQLPETQHSKIGD